MSFDSKVLISINRDVILLGDSCFDLIKGNIAKKSIKDDKGKDIPTFRSDFKMTDTEKTNFEK